MTSTDQKNELIAMAVAAEREACALVCDEQATVLRNAAVSFDSQERRDTRDHQDLCRMADNLQHKAETVSSLAASIRARAAVGKNHENLEKIPQNSAKPPTDPQNAELIVRLRTPAGARFGGKSMALCNEAADAIEFLLAYIDCAKSEIAAQPTRQQIAQAICDWDAKGRCLCAKDNPKLNEHWCQTVVGAADAVLALRARAVSS